MKKTIKSSMMNMVFDMYRSMCFSFDRIPLINKWHELNVICRGSPAFLFKILEMVIMKSDCDMC